MPATALEIEISIEKVIFTFLQHDFFFVYQEIVLSLHMDTYVCMHMLCLAKMCRNVDKSLA